MKEQPRQLPQVHPGLGIRAGQGGNFISVRQKPDQDGGWGTLRTPKRFELPLLTPHKLRSRLGFEAVPASEFWQFNLSGRVRLQVNRLSTDRYANSVGVALLDANNQRVAPLVQSASGRGEPVEVGPGTFKVVASLGIAENIKDLVFEFLATPVGGALKAKALTWTQGAGVLLGRGAQDGRWLRGAAVVGPVSGHGRLDYASLHGHTAIGAVQVIGQAQLLTSVHGRGVHGRGVAQGLGQARLTGWVIDELKGQAVLGPVVGQGRLAAVRWLDQPQLNWRARVTAGVVELNRNYVHFDVDPPSQQRLIEWLRALLAAPDGGNADIPESDTHLDVTLDGGDLNAGVAEQPGQHWVDGGWLP